mmetsp:Transcript_662/g.899  ORF Transcript_662/g.899 Transcript_662/m.899 type:complete len:89 (-) Transcript_662:97-363(-)
MDWYKSLCAKLSETSPVSFALAWVELPWIFSPSKLLEMVPPRKKPTFVLTLDAFSLEEDATGPTQHELSMPNTARAVANIIVNFRALM